MKKLILIIVVLTTLLLTGCSSDSLSPLENRIREFDYYTEIVDFKADYKNLQLLAAYNENDEKVTYIYYMDEIVSDYEILFYVNGEIIHEDFVVVDYEKDGNLIGSFTSSSAGIKEDVVIAEMKLITPGFHTSDSYVGKFFVQEFTIVKLVNDIEQIERVFVSTKNYVDKDVMVAEINIVGDKSLGALLVTCIIATFIYLSSLLVYKSYYNKQIQKQLAYPNNKKRFLLDLVKYKYISLITVLILVIVSMSITVDVIESSFEKIELYDTYQLNYEEVVSESIMLKYGATEYQDNQVAFIQKDSSHNIIGTLEVIMGGEHNHKAYVPNGSYGSYSYKITYRFLTSEYLEINVYEWEFGEQSIYRNVFNRYLNFDGR